MIQPSRKSGPLVHGRVSSGGNSNDEELIEKLFMKAAEGRPTEATRRRKMKQISTRMLEGIAPRKISQRPQSEQISASLRGIRKSGGDNNATCFGAAKHGKR
jgi:hypothetical protein